MASILGGGAVLSIPTPQVDVETTAMLVSVFPNAAGLALDTPVLLVETRQPNGTFASSFIMLDGTAITGLATSDVKFVQSIAAATTTLPISVGEAFLPVTATAQTIASGLIPSTAKSAVVSFIATSDNILWTKATGNPAVAGASTPTQGGGIFELQSPQDLALFSFVCPTAVTVGTSGSNVNIYVEFRA